MSRPRNSPRNSPFALCASIAHFPAKKLTKLRNFASQQGNAKTERKWRKVSFMRRVAVVHWRGGFYCCLPQKRDRETSRPKQPWIRVPLCGNFEANWVILPAGYDPMMNSYPLMAKFCSKIRIWYSFLCRDTYERQDDSPLKIPGNLRVHVRSIGGSLRSIKWSSSYQLI